MSDASRKLPTLPCSGCGDAVDPLRAARVAIFGERFHYFCSATCREQFAPSAAPPRASSRAGRTLADEAPESPLARPAAPARGQTHAAASDAGVGAAGANDTATTEAFDGPRAEPAGPEVAADLSPPMAPEVRPAAPRERSAASSRLR